MTTFRVVHLALLVGFAVVIHTVESFIPMPIPGAKVGLANIIILLTLCVYGFRDALLVSILRSLLGSIFIGQFFSFGFYLSMSGAVISILAMGAVFSLEKKNMLSLFVVSIIGAIAHNTTQVFTAAILMENFRLVTFYLPILLIIAIPTGWFTGIAASHLKNIYLRMYPGMVS